MAAYIQLLAFPRLQKGETKSDMSCCLIYLCKFSRHTLQMRIGTRASRIHQACCGGCGSGSAPPRRYVSFLRVGARLHAGCSCVCVCVPLIYVCFGVRALVGSVCLELVIMMYRALIPRNSTHYLGVAARTIADAAVREQHCLRTQWCTFAVQVGISRVLPLHCLRNILSRYACSPACVRGLCSTPVGTAFLRWSFLPVCVAHRTLPCREFVRRVVHAIRGMRAQPDN